MSSLKRLSRCLASFFFLWFSSMVVLAAPTQAQLIGTHLGEGHYMTQIEIMQMIQGKGVPAGFPVTIQVDASAPESEYQALADAVKAGGFFPIVRIDAVCDKAIPASVVSSVRRIFGPDAVIAFGNEVNNQDNECKNWAQYKENLSLVAGQANLAPSALDAYMGLAQFQIDTMFNTTSGLKTVYGQTDIKVGNAYGCVGNRANDCNVATTNTHEKGIQPYSGAQVQYLTEFSLSPESRVSDAPDTDLKKVVEFIETRGAEVATKFGIRKITPLIRNTCTDAIKDGEWLIYLGEGKVVTKKGTEIDVETCTTGESELAPYYLYPIKGVNEKDRELMKADLYAQGYQAYCTSPQMNVRAVVNNLTDYLYDYVDENSEYLVTNFSFEADFSNLKVPLWRDDVSNPTVMSSIENYWGYLDTTTEGDEQLINSALIYGRTTLQQQCQMKMNILNTVKAMCDGLENPDACPLYDQLPNYDLTFKDMIEKMPKATGNGFSCESYGNGQWAARLKNNSFTPSGITREELVQFTDGIVHVPLYLDKAYRLGFIVLALELKKPIEPLGIQSFTFLRGTNTVGTYETMHEVRILPFKLPDIGTNRDPDSPIYYEDALQLTRNLYLTPQELAKIDTDYAAKRSNVADLHTHIDCSNNSDYCTNNRLVQGLVQFVNEKLERSGKRAYQGEYPAPECEREPDEVPLEEVTTIFGLGGLSESEGTVVANVEPRPATPTLPGSQADTVEALREEYIGQKIPFDPNEGDTPTYGTAELPYKFLTQADAEVREGTNSHPPDQADGVTKIRSYLVVPQGYQLETVENALAAYFVPDYVDTFREAKQNEEIPLYFPLENTGYGQGENGYDITKTITHTDPKYCVTDPITGQVGCSKEILKNEVVIEYQGRNPGILGASLGHLMRVIQQSVLELDNPGWQAINVCETTEDYLLGKCRRHDDTNPPNSINAPTTDLTAACSQMYGGQISVVYDRITLFRKLFQVAKDFGVDPNLMWGIYRIEGGPYRNLSDGLAEGEETTIACSTTINSCGAVGPLQIIQGACVTDKCPSSYRETLKTFVRPGNLCNIDDALRTSASIIQQNIGYVGNDPYKLAGRYHGVAQTYLDQPKCAGAEPVSGCNGMNYCQCAVEGFDDEFNELKRITGL